MDKSRLYFGIFPNWNLNKKISFFRRGYTNIHKPMSSQRQVNFAVRPTIFTKRRKCIFNFISSPQSCSQAIVGQSTLRMYSRITKRRKCTFNFILSPNSRSQAIVCQSTLRMQGRHQVFKSTGAKLLFCAQKQTSNRIFGVISSFFPKINGCLKTCS